MRIWAAITATLITMKLMTIRRVLMLRLLTKPVRSTLSTRAAVADSSRRVYLTGVFCIAITILSVNKSL